MLQPVAPVPALLMPDWILEVAHWTAILPLAVVAFMAVRGRRIDWRWKLIAVAMALSVVVDLIAEPLAQDGTPNLWLTYALAPVQFGLLLTVVVPRTSRIALPAFLLLVAASFAMAAGTVPEHVVSILAGGAVVGCLIAYPRPDARYTAGLIVYCAGTVPGLLALAYLVDPSTWNGPYIAAWAGYQVPRVIALLMLAFAVIPRKLTEVERGRDHRTSGSRVRSARPDAGDARDRRRIRIA